MTYDFSGIANRRVLVTGGLGFIGSNLAIRLTELGCHVTLIDSLIPEYGGNLQNIATITDKVRVNISDVRDPFSIQCLIKNQDFLFNLAGQTSHLDSMEDPVTDLEINAKAQLCIVEACKKWNPEIKVVFASTRQVYGKPQHLPVDENHPLVPVDVNGINKIAGEWYHTLYSRVYGIRTSVLRLTNTYGPRMRIKDARQTFLGIWLRRAVERKPFVIFGDGEQIRDYNYVDDVVDALLLAAVSEKADGQVFNLGADDPMSLNQTASILATVAGDAPYERIPFPKDRKAIDIGDYYGDYRKIRSRLGWRPKIGVEEGLSRSYAYYCSTLSSYIE
jgi:nucleoside-diphosphate-sugar epimerase